jgi:membrane protein YqaA with SNARE-associated domain
VLPFQSEVVLFGLLVSEHYTWWLLVLVASVGNTLGSAANWLLGRLLAAFEDRSWFPVKRTTILRP